MDSKSNKKMFNRVFLLLFLWFNPTICNIIIRLFTFPLRLSGAFASGIYQSILFAYLAGWAIKKKRIKVDSLCVPIGILLVYMLNMALYQGRSVLFETPGDGFTTVFAVHNGIFGYFLFRNIDSLDNIRNALACTVILYTPYNVLRCMQAIKVGYWDQVVDGQRVKGEYNMEVGYILSFLAVSILYFYFRTLKKYYLLVIIALMFFIFTVGSRGALIPPVLYVFIWYILSEKKAKKRIFIIAGILIMFVISYYYIEILSYISNFFLSHNLSSRTLTKLIKGSIGDSNSRVDIWLEILESWINNAFLPKGIYADRELVGMYSHNVIIELCYTFGILGVIMVIWGGWQILKTMRSSYSIDNKLFISIFGCFSLSRLFLSSSFWNERYFWVFLALLITYWENNASFFFHEETAFIKFKNIHVKGRSSIE